MCEKRNFERRRIVVNGKVMRIRDFAQEVSDQLDGMMNKNDE